MSVPQKTQFKKANLQDMRLLFTYLEFCLEQVMHETETVTFPPWAAMHSAVQLSSFMCHGILSPALL